MKDGNSGPRVISLMKFGTQKNWRPIREEVCLKMEKDLKDQGIEDSEEFQTKFHRILEMKKSGVWFTKKEF